MRSALSPTALAVRALLPGACGTWTVRDEPGGRVAVESETWKGSVVWRGKRLEPVVPDGVPPDVLRALRSVSPVWREPWP